jgi:hypothetical protein
MGRSGLKTNILMEIMELLLHVGGDAAEKSSTRMPSLDVIGVYVRMINAYR